MSDLTLGKTTQKRRGWFLPVLIIAVVAAVAVTALALSGALGSMLVDENSADGDGTPQALWESQDIENYRYTLQVGCFCITDMTRPVTIEVLNGEVASITYADDGTEANPELFERYDSIDKIFAVINDAESQDPATLDVAYDETYGVPLSVNIDISEQIADEELYLELSNFETLR